MDRISNLPDDVVLRIVSFLSAKDAARARSVSKNLKNLITIIPDLVFDRPIDDIERSFKLFADQVLAQPVSHRIRKFSLIMQFQDTDNYYNLLTDCQCLCYVLNRGILDLCLDFFVSWRGYYTLPLEVFTCKTVVKMELGSGFVIDHLPNNAFLPALKTLRLNFFRFGSSGGCGLTRLLSVSPVLEELYIDVCFLEQWKQSRVVSSLTLKRLTFISVQMHPGVWSDLEIIGFDTPNLTYLDYIDIVAYGYPTVNLNSLVEAHLRLIKREDSFNPTNLIKGLKNVQLLTLDHINTVQLFQDFSEAVPVFENMSYLSIATERDLCWDGLKFLVKKSPNLKSLTITELHYGDPDMEDVCECLLGYSFLMSVEVLKITNFEGAIGEMAQVKHVLQTLPYLELLEVRIPTIEEIGDEKKLQIMGDLLKLPRASSKCKVEVKF